MTSGVARDGLPEVILHIGTTKTGTSSLQGLWHAHASELHAAGVLYSEAAGQRRHHKLGLYASAPEELPRTWRWRHGHFRDHETFRRKVRRRLHREFSAASVDRVLLSDEALYAKGVEQQRDLAALLADVSRSVRVVVYLRRQDEHLVSRYQQLIKQGSTWRMSEHARHAHAWPYDYHAQLHRWRQTLQPTEFVVRRYEPHRLHGGSLHQDFADAVGLDLRLEPEPSDDVRNVSIDATSIEFLRLLNIFQVEQRGEPEGVLDNRTWLSRLEDRRPGPMLTLPDEVLDDFMAECAESNRRVATDFLGESGDLFTEQRRRPRDSTTHQQIEPEDLAELFERLEVPSSWRGPIRAIREREARAVGCPPSSS